MAPNYNSPEIQSRFGYRSTAEEVTAGLSLDGQTVLVTGCNTGLGYETMRVLALRGAQVIGTARSEESAKRACASVQGNAIGISCELTDPLAIRACVTAIRSREPRIDAIICNAGIMALPKLELVRGYEAQFFVNHVAHFILVTELLDALTDYGRVLVLTSVAHWLAPRRGIEFDNLSGQRSYTSLRAYGQSKLANILFAKELARRLAGTTKTAKRRPSGHDSGHKPSPAHEATASRPGDWRKGADAAHIQDRASGSRHNLLRRGKSCGSRSVGRIFGGL